MSALSSLIDHETTDRRFASLRGVAGRGSSLPFSGHHNDSRMTDENARTFSSAKLKAARRQPEIRKAANGRPAVAG